MSFKALPVDQRSYKRFAFLTPSDTIVIDPPTDAILCPGSSGSLGFVGSDNVGVSFSLPSTPPTILPLSIKQLSSNTSISSIIGLWHD